MHASKQPKRHLLSLAIAGTLGTSIMMGISQDAEAGIGGSWQRASHVGDTVTDNGDGTYTYEYTVFNDSIFNPGDVTGSPFTPVIIDWELPWFDDMGITNIMSPYGWEYAIETIGVVNPDTGWGGVAEWQTPGDPFYDPASPFNDVTQVLHWYCALTWSGEGFDGCEGGFSGIFPEDSLAGFAFDASYDATGAPYQASWFDEPPRTGDPAFPIAGLPASPCAIGQGVNCTGSVPEPGSLALLTIGLAGLAGAAHKRRKQQ